MEITNLKYFTTRKEWRKWLKDNYKRESEVWLRFYKKGSGKPRISYNDSVEEALCFGWIDSTVKSQDKDSYAQRFSPRNPKTPYSQTNIERMENLIQQKKVLKEVMETYSALNVKDYEIPKDILAEVKKNKEAWENYQKFSKRYKRIRMAFVDVARKRPEEFKKRLNYFVKMSAKNKQFGFGGVDKYF